MDEKILFLKKKLNEIPHSPGIYLMKDKNGKIIYVGKAKDLKNRLSSYFSNSLTDRKTSVLVQNVSNIDFIVTENEVEALILEDTFIKNHLPKYNILLKDDKRYPFLKLTLNEDYPKVIVVRKRDNDNALYFGPYTSVKSMRETLKIINRIFPLRKCTKRLKITGQTPLFLKPAGRYCLYYQLNQCLAPCQGEVDPLEYNKIVQQVSLFLQGKNESLLEKLKENMEEYARKLEFEKSARIRDRIFAVEKVMEKQKVISSSFESRDIISFAEKQGIYNITILFVREGKLIGKNNFLIKKKFEQMDTDEILSSFIKQYYSNSSFTPGEILLKFKLEDRENIEKMIYRLTEKEIKIKMPETEFEERLVEMAYQNCLVELSNYLMDVQTKESQKALKNLQKVLNLAKIPKNIEAFDISNISGEYAVGSMVKFVNGLPEKNEYRKFKIKTVSGIDDFKMIEEVVYRRYKRLKEENKDFPDLIVIDGGKGQLSSAIAALEKNEIKNIPIISIAKKEELIFVPFKKEPIKLNRTNPALKLLQNIRDEAHRFAIEFYKKLHEKEITKSVLDEIEGIGDATKTKLLKRFGSIEEIINAPLNELIKIKGVSLKIAKKIKELKKYEPKTDF